MTVPETARAVIIGGGVSGCSVAYHLAKLGWKDVVLLERKQLTSGTTWHAAGLIGQLRASRNMTRLAKYSADLYRTLEEETGVATGMRTTGSLNIALTVERHEELLRQATLARALDVDVQEVSPTEAGKLYPHLNIDDVVGAVHLAADGQCDPANIAMALAKGARQNGVRIIENIRVTSVQTKGEKTAGIRWETDTDQGEIASDIVVNCAGMWGRDLAAQSGVTLPLHACEHFYIVTEPIPELGELPVLRVTDECAYYKEDAGKILLGAFEPKAKPWGMDGIPEDFCFDQLPEDFDHFEPILEAAINRMPMLADVGIHTFFNGPESFTPDGRYYLGQAPEISGYWIAAGYNSIGIVSSGGAGFALAQWINDGEAPFDLWDVDIRRAQPFQNNQRYLRSRVSETLGLGYADHFPHRQYETARGIRRSPIHSHLLEMGAVFGESTGWERANWFANPGQEPSYCYSWKRQNWFENQRAEHQAIRQGVGLIDMTSFGKIRVEGPGAVAMLNRVCANQIDVEVGKIIYTQMLNKNAGIESDLTVTRLSELVFLLVVPGGTIRRDLAWLHQHKGDGFVVVSDVSAAEAVLCVMGPNARELLQAVSPNDFSNTGHPFGTARSIEIGQGIARAHRVSYVGELGWELYVSSDQTAHVFETLCKAGQNHDLKMVGLHAMDSCRIEKAYRHFGHDITDEDNVIDAGLGFAVQTGKGEFIGRDAVLRRLETGPQNRLLQFLVNDPEPLLYHNEALLRDGKIVNTITSGNYGHTLGGAVGLGYVPCAGESLADVLDSKYEIEIAGQRYDVTASSRPMYDPTASRTKC